MSRIPNLTPASMTEAQKEVVNLLSSGPHQRVVGPFPVWLQSPELAKRARALSEYLRFQSAPSKRHAEIAILITGRHWKAEYEFYAHAELARKAGVEEHIIRALAAGKRPELSRADDQAVYDLCTELLNTRRVREATYQRALDTFGMQTLVDLVAIVGYYCMVSLTLNAFEAQLPHGEPSPFPD